MSAAEATLAEPPPGGPAGAGAPAFDLAGAIGALPAAGAAGVALHGMLTARYGADLAAARLDRDWLLRTLDREVAAIDDLLTRQVNAILHAEPVQRLEARWRGLLYLVGAAEASPLVKIKVLPVSWVELVRDLERASDFDQSELFQKVYSTEFGTPGGEPYGLLVGDYEVRHRPEAGHPTDDVGALNVLAMVAAASFSPVILGVAPSVLQVDGFRELARTSNIRGVFDQREYDRWTSARRGDDMRFIGLALPRVLMRAPYGPDPKRRDNFTFSEDASELDGSGCLWGSAGFAFAQIVIRAFATSGWFADLRGAPRDELRGGIVSDLPVVSFASDRPGIAVKPSLEALLSEAHDKDLSDLGFMTLRNMPLTDYSVFYSVPSFQSARRQPNQTAAASARLSSMLQYTLCVSRFAHYIKVLGRDRLGSITTAEETQVFLQSWLRKYCEGSDSASQEAKARCPLKEAAVEVRDSARDPGVFACTIHLRPHYQLDDIATGFRLTTTLSPQRAA